ncbi:MAG: PLP-dependent aminotransferase family protein [Thermomicrobiales bacterium]
MTTSVSLYDLLSERARQSQDNRGGGRQRPGLISFSFGYPDPERLPLAGVAEAATRALSTHGQWPLQYGPTLGYEGLLDLLVEKLGRDQGIACTRENLILTAGGSQALGLLCDLFVNPGDTILSEAPTWLGAVRTFENTGAHVASIPVDESGTNVDALADTLAGLRQRGIAPKFFYIIPNFQNPTGVTTTLERRRRIVELAREYNFAILEDDAYHDLRFAGERLPTLYELDGGRQALYFGTFSKILAAGMRLGWIVAEPGLIARLGVLKTDGSTNPFAAHVAYEYCKDGALEARIQELIAVYRHRRDLILGELSERMPEGVTWTHPDGGFFVWLTLPDSVDSVRLLDQARERGVDFHPGTVNFFDGSGHNHLRLSYSYASDADTVRGVRILAEVVQEMVAGDRG